MNEYTEQANYVIQQGFKILICRCTVFGTESTLDCLTNKERTHALPLIEFYPVLHKGQLINFEDILLRPKQSQVITLNMLRARMPKDADRLVVEISKRF